MPTINKKQIIITFYLSCKPKCKSPLENVLKGGGVHCIFELWIGVYNLSSLQYRVMLSIITVQTFLIESSNWMNKIFKT